MAIPVILRGDTSSIIRLSVAEGDYTDCILEVSFFGVLRQFKNVVGNSVITLEWTAEETVNFPLGTNRLLVSIRRGDFVRTLPFPKVKVTDAPAEVYEGTIEIAPKLFDLPDLTVDSTLGDVKTTLNAIKDALRGGLALFLSVILLSSNAAELTPDTIMDKVPGYATISNVVAAARVAIGGSTDGAAVTNIAENVIKRDVPPMINSKRNHTDLTYTHRLKRTGAAYVMVIYDAKTQERLETVAMPLFEERLDVGIYTQRNYQTIINGKTYFLSVTFGFSQDWLIAIMNDGKIETSYSWTRTNDGKQTPSLEETDGKYIYVLYYDTRAEIIEDVPDTLALSSDVKITTDHLSATLKTVKSDVDTVKSDLGTATTNANEALELAGDVATLVYGDDCQLVSTNYNSATKMPSLFLRFKIKNETTGEMEWYKVWDELTRWNWLFDDYMPSNYYTKAELDVELDQKADRAWGNYDSTTGNYAPEGFTWISHPSIAIAGGLAYQRILTTEGAVWVLESNGMTTFTGGETNGFFRISDDKGNSLFEITKGTEKVVGATANATRTESIDGVTHLFITYNVASAEPPKLEICRKLTRDTAPDWKLEDAEDCPARVSWTGSSGAWIAEVYGKTAEPSLFVKGTYKQGAKDMIKNSAPVSFTEIVIDGVTYKVKVETISGKKVLVLE